MLQGQFARLVHTGEHSVGACSILWYTRGNTRKVFQFVPGTCFKIFNQFNTVEHFAGWKSWSQEWITPLKSLVLTKELCSRSVPLEQNHSRVSALTLVASTRVSSSLRFSRALTWTLRKILFRVPCKRGQVNYDSWSTVKRLLYFQSVNQIIRIKIQKCT